jgi:TonB family protein
MSTSRDEPPKSGPVRPCARALVALAAGAMLLAADARAADEPAGPPTELRPFCGPGGYPLDAALAGAQGSTRLRYAIGADGRAEAIEVAAPSGATPAHALLDKAAVAFLQACRFEKKATPPAETRELAYTWRIAALGRDRWNLLRLDAPADAPDVYPELLSWRECGLPSWPTDTHAKVKADDLILLLRIDKRGAVHGTEIVRSSGQRVIDDEVRQAAPDCRFRPALRGGQPVAAAMALMYGWAPGASPQLLPPWRPSAQPPGQPASAAAAASAVPPAAPPTAAVAPAAPPAVAPAAPPAAASMPSTTLASAPAARPVAPPPPPPPPVPVAVAPAPSTKTATSPPVMPPGTLRIAPAASVTAPQPAAPEATPPPPTPAPATSVADMRAAPTATGGCAAPDYPGQARQNGESGTVVLGLHYDPSGALLKSTVVESSGHALLDDAVRSALERCRFAQVFGTGRVRDQEIEYTFKLE